MRRPHGQTKDSNGAIQFGPSKALDFELEVGAFIASGNALGLPVPIEAASSQVFGYCLLNDWSARDTQFWESMLGPFLGKSFSTSISPWIVSAEALAPFNAPVFTPTQPDWPATLPYLQSETDRAEGGMNIESRPTSRRAGCASRGSSRPALLAPTLNSLIGPSHK